MSKEHIRFISHDKEKKTFFRTVRKRVNAYFRENGLSPHANGEMIAKTVIMLSIYILPFLSILFLQPPFWASLFLWSLMGIGVAGIGMCIMHDACHGAYSNKNWVNEVMGRSLNLAGGSTFNWKIQHNKLHHVYTNIIDLDEDVEDKGVVRLSPHTEVKSYHRTQWFHAFFFYGLLTLYWTLGKDFVQWIKYTRNGHNPYKGMRNVRTFLLILLDKALYFTAIFFVPVYFFAIPFYQIVLGFLLMHSIAGLILGVVFQLAHAVEGTEHPRPDDDGRIREAWAVHEMKTTANFCRNNRFINWFVGGLNFQVEHHLFPTVCHVHYPQIAPIVKETAEEYGIPYMEHLTLSAAIRSHMVTLKRFGLPDMEEAIG
ncbi:MAG: fatty acid desaturase [Flavobacteriales bacterium]